VDVSPAWEGEGFSESDVLTYPRGVAQGKLFFSSPYAELPNLPWEELNGLQTWSCEDNFMLRD